VRKLVLLALLAACGGEVSVVEVPPQQMPPPPPPTATVQVQVAPVTGLMNAGENWIGRYQCAQGLTDLDLRIDAVNGSTIDATFIFAHGPSGAAGSYSMRGTIDPSGNLTLVPGAWIARPPNYVSVGMSGVVNGSAFRGRIDNPSCGIFTVRRSNEQ
jgi:hypothetical protein